MLTLLVAAWMALPLYPLNPVEQDTLGYMNLHVTAGMGGPNRLMAVSPEISAKYELALYYPFVIRTSVDYRPGHTRSNTYPEADFHNLTWAIGGLYYRGTQKWTGFIGADLIYGKTWLDLSAAAADSVRTNHGIGDMSVRGQFGYRLTLGLRYREHISLEVAISAVSYTHLRAHET